MHWFVVKVGLAKPIFRFIQNERQTRSEGFLRQTPDISPVVSDATPRKAMGMGIKKIFDANSAETSNELYIRPPPRFPWKTELDPFPTKGGIRAKVRG